MSSDARQASSTTAYTAGVLAVLLWSTAVLVAAQVARMQIPYSVIAFFPIAVGWAFVTAFSLLYRSRFTNAIKQLLTPKTFAFAFLAGVTLAIYEVLFWYSLVNGPRLEVNAINYLWPIFQLLITLLLFRGKDPLRASEILLVITAYFGAILVALPANPSTFSLRANLSYLVYAFFGSLAIGLHFSIARFIRRDAHDVDPVFQSIAWNVLVWPICLLVLAIYFVSVGAPIVELKSLTSVALVLWEGVVVFGIGYLCYIFSIQQYPSLGLSGIIYVTPIVGAIWLVVLFRETSNSYFWVGLIMIFASNYLLHSRFRHLNPGIIATAAWGLALSYCLVVPGWGKANLLEALSSLGAVMGILLGFTLSRLASADREQTTTYLAIFAQIRRLRQRIPANHPIQNSLIGFAHACTNYFFVGARRERLACSVAISDKFHSLRQEFLSASLPSTTELDSLEADMTKWMVIKSERMPTVEWLALSGLSMFFAIVFAAFRENNIGGDLAALLVASGTAFLIATMRDLDVDRPSIGSERLRLVLNAYTAIDTSPYLPYHLVSQKDFALWSLRDAIEVVTSDSYGQLECRVIDPPKYLERFLFLVSLTSVFIIGFAAIVYKHM
jgi:drug/metabolite transporter (DMT)-like permease